MLGSAGVERALIRPSATFSHAFRAGEGTTLMHLLPCPKAWEKVAEGRMWVLGHPGSLPPRRHVAGRLAQGFGARAVDFECGDPGGG